MFVLKLCKNTQTAAVGASGMTWCVHLKSEEGKKGFKAAFKDC